MRVTAHTVSQRKQPAMRTSLLRVGGDYMAQVVFVVIPQLSVVGERRELYVEHDLKRKIGAEDFGSIAAPMRSED